MEVANNIIEVLKFLFEKFGIAVDWTANTIMPYVEMLMNRYIHYSIGMDIFWIVSGIAFTIISIIGIKIGISGIKKYGLDDFDEDGMAIGSIILIIFAGIFVIVGVIVFLDNVADLIKCFTFPELKFFEYVKEMVSAVQ